MAKGQFRLLADHYFPGDMYLEKGTLVGDGTPWPVVGPPSFNMEPLNPEAMAAMRTERTRPDMPADVRNPTGMNLAPGPGQKVLGGIEAAKAKASSAAGVADILPVPRPPG